MQDTDYPGFEEAVRGLAGLPCSVIAATAGCGSMILLYFGDTYWETVTLPSFGSRTFEKAVYGVSLDFAAWRCRQGAHMLCSSSSRNGVASPMELGLAKLMGMNVLEVRLEEPAADLHLVFEDGLTFDIFCDQVDTEEDPHDNYSFRCPAGSFIVGPGSRLRFEPHVG